MPSRSTLLTDQYSRARIECLGNYAEEGALLEYSSQARTWLRDTTLLEVLRSAGYDTALFGKWHVLPAPYLVGFDYALFPLLNHNYMEQTF